jgi:hypothetical protein
MFWDFVNILDVIIQPQLATWHDVVSLPNVLNDHLLVFLRYDRGITKDYTLLENNTTSVGDQIPTFRCTVPFVLLRLEMCQEKGNFYILPRINTNTSYDIGAFYTLFNYIIKFSLKIPLRNTQFTWVQNITTLRQLTGEVREWFSTDRVKNSYHRTYTHK